MQISRNPFILLVGAFASALILSACGGGEEGAQATLTVVPEQSSLSAGASTSLTTSGGSGDGAVTFAVASGSCTIDGPKLTAASSAGTCLVTATKAADTTYAATTSATVTITVTASTTFANFEEQTPPTLTPFPDGGSMVAAVAADPVNGSNNVAKLEKSDSAPTWAGATISTCAYPSKSVPVIPLTADNTKLTLRVYSTAANKVIRMKLEDASNSNVSVETDAVVIAANTWQTVTFDFSVATTPPTAAFNPASTYNKVSVFPNFGTQAASTMYVDDLKFAGVANLTCMTVPVVVEPKVAADLPTYAAAKVIALYSDSYPQQVVSIGPFPNQWSSPSYGGEDLDIGGNKAAKTANLSYAILEPTATIDISDYAAIRFSVWTSAGTKLRVKLVDFGASGTYGGGNDVEHEITLDPPTQGGWTYYNIPISQFTGLTTKQHFAQLIFSVGAADGGTVADFWFDDIYFTKP